VLVVPARTLHSELKLTRNPAISRITAKARVVGHCGRTGSRDVYAAWTKELRGRGIHRRTP